MKRVAFLIASGIIFLAGSLMGQELEYVSSTLFVRGLQTIYVDGGYAYCISSEAEAFQIISIDNPESPELIGGYPLGMSLRDFCVNGGYVYVAAEGDGLCIIDITDRARPLHVSTYSDHPNARSIANAGDYAYLLADSCLYVLDISEPLNPEVIGSCALSEYSKDIIVSGEYAYIVEEYGGMIIADISNPANPTIAGYADTPWDAVSVDVHGSYAYVLDYFEDPPVQENGLRVFDISDPTSPTIIGNWETYADGGDIRIAGNIAFIASGYNGLDIIDVSDPSNPVFLGNFNDWDSSPYYGVSIADSLAFIAGHSGLSVIDIVDPSNPYQTGSYSSIFTVYDVHVSGGYGYATGFRGLYIVSTENPYYPRIIGACTGSWSLQARQVFASGDSAYIAAGFYTKIIDVGDRQNPELVGSLHPFNGGSSSGVFVYNGYLYKADGIGGLQIVNLDHPDSSRAVITPGSSKNVFVTGDLAYVADASYLTIVDVSDPGDPSLAGYVPTPGIAFDVYKSGDFAYVADGESGISVFNVTDPYSPFFIGSCYLNGSAAGIEVSGDFGYLAIGNEGVAVVDLSNPYVPVLLSGYDTPGRAEDLYIDGDYVYVADYKSLLILGISRTDINENRRNMPLDFALAPAYPNPFNASTTIQYDLPSESEVRIEIYDLLGRKIETLAAGLQPAGSHSVVWDAEDLSSGVYFYRIEAGDYQETRKCVLLR